MAGLCKNAAASVYHFRPAECFDDDAMPTIHSVQSIVFGPFLLSPAQRLLLRADKPVTLGSRAWEILLMLVQRPGEVVGKRELMERVWPDIAVEEGTLRVHVSDLRKALGHGQQGTRYIENVTGRGYRFVAPLSRADEGAPQNREGAPAEDPTRVLIELLRHAQLLIVLEGGEAAAAAARLLSRTHHVISVLPIDSSHG